MSFRPNCVFCNITHYHDRDAKIWYVDNDIMVIRNRLTWVPVMLLVMPKQHLDQFDMWSNGLMPRLGNIAVELGTAFALEASAFCRISGVTACKARATATCTSLAACTLANTLD